MIEPVPKETCFLFDLSNRAKFRVCGSDRLRFLNGQITNDLRKATETDAIEACVLNAKGKIDAHVFICAAQDSYFLDGDVGLRDAIPARLDRYIIADDVQVEDVTDEFDLFHLLDSAQPVLPNESKVVRAHRFSIAGWDAWVKRSDTARVRESFSQRWTMCDDASAEALRIRLGIPRWGRELTNEIIPIEANLEERCVDYLKGCYIGQEVISRIKMSGQTNKRLCGLASLDGLALSPSMRLTAATGDRRDVGWVTSSDYNPQIQKHIGLGFVKRGFNAPGTHLRAAPAADSAAPTGVHVDVVPLPFV
jgi:folate-binding protein YgfZ